MNGLVQKSSYSKWDKNSGQKHLEKEEKINSRSINTSINKKYLLVTVMR